MKMGIKVDISESSDFFYLKIFYIFCKKIEIKKKIDESVCILFIEIKRWV